MNDRALEECAVVVAMNETRKLRIISADSCAKESWHKTQNRNKASKLVPR